MSFLGFFRKKQKQKYIVDKTPITNEEIKNNFQFLINSGYELKFYQKYTEREFIYTLKDCRVEVFLDGYIFDCIIQTRNFPRLNITQNPLVSEEFNDKFYLATNQERIDMIINLLQKHADLFLLK